MASAVAVLGQANNSTAKWHTANLLQKQHAPVVDPCLLQKHDLGVMSGKAVEVGATKLSHGLT